MNKEAIETILKGGIDPTILTDEEKEIVLKVLSNLDGVLVIRATSILNFCLKAVQYSKVTGLEKRVDDFNCPMEESKKETAQEVPVQEQSIKVIAQLVAEEIAKQIAQGSTTINKARNYFGLPSIKNEIEAEIVIRATCKNDKEVESISNGINRLIRQIEHTKNEKVNYEVVIENLEKGKTQTIRNKRRPRELDL